MMTGALPFCQAAGPRYYIHIDMLVRKHINILIIIVLRQQNFGFVVCFFFVFFCSLHHDFSLFLESGKDLNSAVFKESVDFRPD